MPLKRGSTNVVRLYRKEADATQTEVTELKDNLNRAIHKRISIFFEANGGSGSSTQTRTWGVENITVPPSPTRSGHDFQGWATTSGATSPNVTLPMLAPQNSVIYYAVWEEHAPQLKWKYQGESSTKICFCNGQNPLSTPCSVAGSTQVVCGPDIARPLGSCHTLVCGV